MCHKSSVPSGIDIRVIITADAYLTVVFIDTRQFLISAGANARTYFVGAALEYNWPEGILKRLARIPHWAILETNGRENRLSIWILLSHLSNFSV